MTYMYLPFDLEKNYVFRAPELSQISVLEKPNNDDDDVLMIGGIEILLWRFDNTKMFLRHPKKKKMVFSVRGLILDAKSNKMQGKCILFKKKKNQSENESESRYCLTFFYNNSKEEAPVFLSKPTGMDVQFKPSKKRIVVEVMAAVSVARYDKKKRLFWFSETESAPYKGPECYRMRDNSYWFVRKNENTLLTLRPLQFELKK